MESVKKVLCSQEKEYAQLLRYLYQKTVLNDQVSQELLDMDLCVKYLPLKDRFIL